LAKWDKWAEEVEEEEKNKNEWRIRVIFCR
jgi:hypothetical protein